MLANPIFGVLGGLAAVEALRDLTSLAFEIKWPNDVLIDGRKIGGVLAEAAATPEPAVVIGIGLNVHHTRDDLPTNTPVPPTSLALERAPAPALDRTTIVEHILRQLDAAYTAVRTNGVTWLGDRVTRVWNERNRWVAFEGGSAPPDTGRATAIDLDRGVIRLETQPGTSVDIPLTAFIRLRRLPPPRPPAE